MAGFPFSKRFRRAHPSFTRWVLLGTAFLTAFGAGFAYASWAMVCRAGRCPPVHVLEDYTPRQTSKLYAADGQFLAELGIERRTLIQVADIPEHVKEAFVVVEDKRFYNHAGIDWYRVPGAFLNNLRTMSWSQGFSTITMQLARNIFPDRITREKSPVRKLKEAKVARQIESQYSKERILELYLNQIYLGNGAHGVETASQRYFGKSVREVNVAEAAMLAALPKAPERYNPRRFPDRAVQRRNTVIGVMQREHRLNEADASLARAFPLRLASRAEAGETAPYFVEYVRQLLDERFGRQLYEQGLRVFTTLDVDLQTAAERAMERQIRAIEAGQFGPYRHVSYESHMARTAGESNQNLPNSPYLQGAFVAMDPRTGAVRALVGGRDFDDNKFNRATQALRQPGSAFKPVVYADAIQGGRAPAYIVDDSPLSVTMSGGTEWTPRNYEGSFEGPITMRRSLTVSRNVSTIRLGMEMGEQSVIGMARRLGISSPIPPYPSIHIGSAEVYPIELVAAYSAFATLGTRVSPMAIVRVENARGELLWAPEPRRVPALSPEESWLMVSMLKDVVRRGTAARTVGASFHVPAGGKTGTTNDRTDVWYVGFTPDLLAGVWIGFDRPRTITAGAAGGVLAAPAWTAFMQEAYRSRPTPRDWPVPPGIIAREVDASTGLLASEYCPRSSVSVEYFVAGTEPYRQCDVHSGFHLWPDTNGIAPYPPPATQPPVFPPGGGAGDVIIRGRVDTVFRPARPPGTIFPNAPPPRQPDAPRDTVVRRADTIFLVPRRDTVARPPDTLRTRPR